MRRARNQTILTQSNFPAKPHNSRGRTAYLLVATAHESPAPSNLFPCRSRPGSKPSNPSPQRDPPSQTLSAFRQPFQSSLQTDLPQPIGSSKPNSLFPNRSASANSPRAAAARPTQIL